MKTIKDFDINGKRVLVRVDFNVPINSDLQITDDTRIQAALPTINHILNNGGSVVLMSHLGRPKLGPESRFSLSLLVNHLTLCLGLDVKFANDCLGNVSLEMSRSLQAGEVLLLENVRFYAGEKEGSESFAGQLAKHGDFYVNDAFGTAHRAHASTSVIARFYEGRKSFGFLMARELNNLQKVIQEPKKPFTAVIGGAKVSSKISIIEKLLPKITSLIIGGGMSYTFIKAMGGSVGNSLVENDYLETALSVLKKAEEAGVRVFLPEDSVIADSFDNNANRKSALSDEIPEGWMALDVGPEATGHYITCLKESRTILWNGPMGVFEMSNFETGTHEVANAIVESTERGAFSLVGGGDSVAAVNKYHLKDHVSYLSTGGGAMLEYIEGKTLPGVAAILN